MLRLYLLAVVMLVVSANALAQRAPSADEIAEAGTFDGQLYTNKALGMTILAPGGWSFQTYAQDQALVNANRLKNSNASSANTQVLFQSAQPKALAGVDPPATFSAGIERLPTPMTARAYAEANQKLVLSASPVILVSEIQEKRFGNTGLTTFEVAGKTGDKAYWQRYVVTMRNGVAVFFVATFYHNRQESAVDNSLASLKFGK